jgi:DNA primase
LRSVELPAAVREVVIAADNDEPGEKAARDAAQRFLAEGRCVKIARPSKGKDFNDVLRGMA